MKNENNKGKKYSYQPFFAIDYNKENNKFFMKEFECNELGLTQQQYDSELFTILTLSIAHKINLVFHDEKDKEKLLGILLNEIRENY